MNSKQFGFTLLELLIVVIIVGILASVTLPQLTGFVRRAVSSEAENTVGALLTAQFAYFQEEGSFTNQTSGLLVKVPADGTTMFNYTLTFDGTDTGTVTAVGLNAVAQGAHDASGISVVGTITKKGVRTIQTAGL